MQLSNILYSIVSLSLVSSTLGAPTENVRRDDDEGPVIVKLTTTVHNVATNTKIIQGSVSTRTNTIINTDTTTTTRYTATVTSTVFGTPITYTTVAPTPIDTSNIKIPTETVTTSSSSSSSSSSSPQKTQQPTTIETTSTAPKTTSTPTTAPTTTPVATTSVTTVTDSTDNGPSITDIANIPASTGSWIIENITTSKSDGVCVVDYDYYATGEQETVTSTSTIYHTVTRS
ncbi:filamentous growth regulator 41 [[Candida] jaroonii]|uniref:Filamentous growth regulator 41 n=1 Tax=[Candida] jaroonii TaxID=467808 RepID=A0ACA9Y6G2_9ASCO|nr:filamentous growth regulator 41 [[Candida] jaroonii]